MKTTISIVNMWFYGQIALPITEPFCRTFPNLKISDRKWGHFGLNIFFKERVGGCHCWSSFECFDGIFCFSQNFLEPHYVMDSWLYDPSRCLTAWNNYQLTGTGISLPQDLTRSLERTRPPTWAFLRLQTLPRTETWHRQRPSQRVRRDP